MFRIESLLSARLFLSPQSVGDRLYFISDMSGRLSLYAMNYGGSVPEPLLPPHISLQDPHHLQGSYSFYVFPALGKILVMIDNDGDEKYQPMLIPLEGGFPEPAFGDKVAEHQVYLFHCYPEQNLVYMTGMALSEGTFRSLRGNLKTGEVEKLAQSRWGSLVAAVSANRDKAILGGVYDRADVVLYLWRQVKDGGEQELLYGTPLEQRTPGQKVPRNGIDTCHFTEGDKGVLVSTVLFDDAGGIGYIDMAAPQALKPVSTTGIKHEGPGELVGFTYAKDNLFAVEYNIDGASWLYEGAFDEEALTMSLETIICGEGRFEGGVVQSARYDGERDRYALSFSTACAPTQLYTVEGGDRETIIYHTNERVLGIPDGYLSSGEDASFTSHDGLRISARLYLPATELEFAGPRPLVYYVHGGPQGQERPDFAWFSMPIIQYLTLNGFAVFVPNVRGSTGYGRDYASRVERDWGGQDRLDHVHAMGVLARDGRIDTKRAAVIGRSYGGYMTLTLASRHPQLWSAAVDMFGQYDLVTASERIPVAWKALWHNSVGDPERDRDFLIERSPATYLHNIACPILVLQGRNDPRVIEQESREVVEQLRRAGKEVEYKVFENEGHDVLKYENKVTCYNSITDFFKKHLRP
jgi:pimeloyl-ACP methyl ester carboxylesterase